MKPQVPAPQTRRAQALAYLSGKTLQSPHPKAITAAGQGGKFDPQGNVLNYPGNTFICHIDPGSDFYQGLSAVQDGLKAASLAESYIFLPKPSFHMTIFCGVSGSPLGNDGWPNGFASSVGLEEMTATYSDRLADWATENIVSVVADGMSMPGTVRMVPATSSDEQSLLQIRHRLQSLTGLFRDDIETYEFHVSLGYLRSWYSEREALEAMSVADDLFDRHLKTLGPQPLGPIEFCTFETMLSYTPVQFLGIR